MPKTEICSLNVVDFDSFRGRISKIELFLHSDREIAHPNALTSIRANVWQIYDVCGNVIKYDYFSHVYVDIENRKLKTTSDSTTNKLMTAPNITDVFNNIQHEVNKLR